MYSVHISINNIVKVIVIAQKLSSPFQRNAYSIMVSPIRRKYSPKISK